MLTTALHQHGANNRAPLRNALLRLAHVAQLALKPPNNCLRNHHRSPYRPRYPTHPTRHAAGGGHWPTQKIVGHAHKLSTSRVTKWNPKIHPTQNHVRLTLGNETARERVVKREFSTTLRTTRTQNRQHMACSPSRRKLMKNLTLNFIQEHQTSSLSTCATKSHLKIKALDTSDHVTAECRQTTGVVNFKQNKRLRLGSKLRISGYPPG